VKRRHRILRLTVILVVLVVICSALAGSFLLRGMSPQPRPVQYARWLFDSGEYKRLVLAQPPGPAKSLKHTEWDGWGWGGNDTTVYLVFDPDNALEPAARGGSAGKYPGIPCEVYRVRRLESHWYTVQFYTGTDWSNC
jgi:hypothetical protein